MCACSAAAFVLGCLATLAACASVATKALTLAIAAVFRALAAGVPALFPPALPPPALLPALRVLFILVQKIEPIF